MYSKTSITVCLLTSSLFFSYSSMADTQLTFSDSTQVGTHSSTIQIRADKVRMGSSNSKIYTIYDSNKQILYTINPEVKQYMATTLESVKENMRDAVAMREARLKKKSAQMSEEQRQALEEKLAETERKKQAKPAKIETQAKNKTETVQGLTCKVFTVLSDGKPIKETCIAKQGIDTEDMAQLQTLFDFMKNVAEATAKIRNLPAPDAGLLPNYQGGLVIKAQALPDGAKSELSKLSNDKLDAALFELPATYSLRTPRAAASKASPNTNNASVEKN